MAKNEAGNFSCDETHCARDTRIPQEKNLRLVHRRKPEVNPFMADILGQVKMETENLLRMMDEHLDHTAQHTGLHEDESPE